MSSSPIAQPHAFTALHHGGAGPPLVLLHGFMDTWRTWELALPSLEPRLEVLAPTLAGHAGGPALPERLVAGSLADAVERALDESGLETAHLAGNSLGGFVALQLAERGRARSVTALAPAGGWAVGDTSYREVLAHQAELHEGLKHSAGAADFLVATEAGRRRATEAVSVRFEHIPADLIAHMLVGIAGCDGANRLIELALADSASAPPWELDVARIACPVRIVWGTDDLLLPWPSAAARFRDQLPHADWVVLDGVGHAPQLDVPLETAELIAGFASEL